VDPVVPGLRGEQHFLNILDGGVEERIEVEYSEAGIVTVHIDAFADLMHAAGYVRIR
jgi:hypothetical protein